MEFAITIDDIVEARSRIAPHIYQTPLLRNEAVNEICGLDLWLKAENLQVAGAFKSRGATNAIFGLTEAERRKGVVTHSSGNHASALARAATRAGVRAHVVMPKNSAGSKIALVRQYGVEPVFCEPTAEARQATADALMKSTGATMVHPYNHPHVMAGQGTIGLEILEACPDVQVLLLPIGGGGLLSGNLIAIKQSRPDVRVVAVEPELADDAFRSQQIGTIQMPTRYDTVADGLRSPLGSLTFPIIQSLVDEIILVSEKEILAATRLYAEKAKMVVEPSGAVTLAGAQKIASELGGKRTAIVISGGNMDFGSCQLGRPHPT